jgi:hypothetical protein
VDIGNWLHGLELDNMSRRSATTMATPRCARANDRQPDRDRRDLGRPSPQAPHGIASPGAARRHRNDATRRCPGSRYRRPRMLLAERSR